MAILRVFGVAALVNVILSMLLASHHRQSAAPACRPPPSGCAAASRAARKSPISPTARTRSAICRSPLRDMTNALYARIDAIESFAADVSHELKNPLTSLRSAVETLPLARNDDFAQAPDGRHPARRAPARPADHRHFRRLAPRCRTGARGCGTGRSRRSSSRDLVDVSRRTGAPQEGSRDRLQGRPSCRAAAKGYFVIGHDLRIGQVITNLIENARSFVPEEGGRIDIRMSRAAPAHRLTGRGQRSRHPGRQHRPDLRALLHRPAGRRGLRPEFRPRPVDQPADRRGAWRHADRREHPRQPSRARSGGARFIVTLPRRTAERPCAPTNLHRHAPSS